MEDKKFKVLFDYIASSRPTGGDPASDITKPNQTKSGVSIYLKLWKRVEWTDLRWSSAPLKRVKFCRVKVRAL